MPSLSCESCLSGHPHASVIATYECLTSVVAVRRLLKIHSMFSASRFSSCRNHGACCFSICFASRDGLFICDGHGLRKLFNVSPPSEMSVNRVCHAIMAAYLLTRLSIRTRILAIDRVASHFERSKTEKEAPKVGGVAWTGGGRRLIGTTIPRSGFASARRRLAQRSGL